jgi:hypothetical protein
MFMAITSPMSCSCPRWATNRLAGSPNVSCTVTLGCSLVRDDAKQAGIFCKEQSAVDQDTDLTLG